MHLFIKWPYFVSCDDINRISETFKPFIWTLSLSKPFIRRQCSIYVPLLHLCTIQPPPALLLPLHFLSHRLRVCLKMPPLLTYNPLPPLRKDKGRVLIKGLTKKLPLLCFCTINNTHTHTHTCLGHQRFFMSLDKAWGAVCPLVERWWV